jgi:hypothetical protein
MSSTISIQEVLSYIRSDEGASDTFLIKFVRASGKKKGSIKTVAKARYGAVKPKDRGNGMPKPSENTPRLHVDAGTLPMTDTERNSYFTPLISHIIQFNQYKVIH